MGQHKRPDDPNKRPTPRKAIRAEHGLGTFTKVPQSIAQQAMGRPLRAT